MKEESTPPHIQRDHQLPAHAGEDLPARPKRHHWLVWLLLLLAFGLVFWWVMHRKADPAAGAPPGGRRGAMGGPVTTITATAAQGDIGVYQDAIGTVTPVYTDSIVSQVTGLVTQVRYKEGQLVRKGQPLIEIDSRSYAATLKQAQGTLQRDENLLAQAQMDLARYQAAWDRNAIAKQQLDDQQKIVLQDEGTVKTDQGSVEFDAVQLGYCHIVSPIAGRVGLRLVDPGNVVTSGGGTTLAVITQLQPITVVFTISEDNLQTVLDHMRHGQSLEVQAMDRAQQTILAKGKLQTADNQIDTTTGTVKLRAIFDNKDETLFPNQFVNTRLLVNTLRGVTLLPSSAIQHNGSQAFVWLVTNGTANMRNVQEGVTDNGQTAVTGINPGDVVANSSFEKLQPGSKIVPPSPGGRTGAGHSQVQGPGQGSGQTNTTGQGQHSGNGHGANGAKGNAAASGGKGSAGSTAP